MEKIDIPFRFIDAQKIKTTTSDFNIPDMENLDKISVGDKVRISNGKEHFLVKIDMIDKENLQGRVENLLLENADYDRGDHIAFRKSNVLQVAPKLSFKEIIAKFSDDEILNIKKFPGITTYFPFTKTPEKLLMNKEAIYSTSYPRIMKTILETIETDLKSNLKNLIVTDATANVGGSVICFAKQAKLVHAVEINPETYKLLINNVSVYNLKNVKFYNDDYLKIMHNLTQDVVFIDPPWGGLDYKTKSKMMLFLGEIPLWQIAKDLLPAAKLISLKVPVNFDTELLEKHIDPNFIHYHNLNKLLIINIKK